MVQIGRINRLTVKKTRDFGIHLEGGDVGDIVLRDKFAAQKYQPNDVVDVFVYVDKEQRLVATVHKPYAMVGEVATLRVVATSPAGAFLGWGLEDDLFVPKSEQLNNMRVGKSYVVFVFQSDKTNRITASSKLDKYLDQQTPKCKEGEEVDLIIYGQTDLGFNAVVNNAYVGILYENEVFQKITVGQKLKGYVKKVRHDSKIDLRLHQTGYQQVDDISQAILDTIKKSGGIVRVTDKSQPEEIYAMFGVSKKVFKKAVGALYKQRIVVIESDGIRLAE
jgi:predicted RNA-binding protein (virulence factor B family)